ncbi:MAG: hypothetical protein RSF90_06645, partial [Pygmaiobacter sp.]
VCPYRRRCRGVTAKLPFVGRRAQCSIAAFVSGGADTAESEMDAKHTSCDLAFGGGNTWNCVKALEKKGGTTRGFLSKAKQLQVKWSETMYSARKAGKSMVFRSIRRNLQKTIDKI